MQRETLAAISARPTNSAPADWPPAPSVPSAYPGPPSLSPEPLGATPHAQTLFVDSFPPPPTAPSAERAGHRAHHAPVNDRNIHLPKFTGKTNVEGYFAVFERLHAGISTDEETKARHLISKLEGAAQQWLLGQGSAWVNWGYTELKAALVKHFKGESTVYQRKLLSLKCTSDLAKF